ncbi:single-stranded DNA-binding protein [Mucilaginibacter sp. CSA2-8R]|uniref:single-stranded DNA-binding protein n=1 Tax=Mucilaginibacter sp. CSA2-8R TaxID=3141542 RepID=UPI00315DD6E5
MLNNAGINKVFLLGEVVLQPTLKHQTDGQGYYHFPLATRESIQKNQLPIQHTEQHQIKIGQQQLNKAACHLIPGQLIYLEGRIKTNASVDENGTKRYYTEIWCSSLKVL